MQEGKPLWVVYGSSIGFLVSQKYNLWGGLGVLLKVQVVGFANELQQIFSHKAILL